MDFKLYINNQGTIHDATELCEGEIKLDRQRRGSPSKLTFKILRYGNINYQEGNEVLLQVKGETVFKGYVFKKSRDKEQLIDTICYDQMIYLKKNKDTFVYTNKKASEILEMIAGDYKLTLGDVEDSGYIIPARSEDIQTLIDIIYNAIDLTVINTGKLFVLYDDAGRLTLTSIENLKTDKLVSANNTLINYQYSTDIDTDTYNKIKLVRDNQKTGRRDAYIELDSGNMAKWGILQLQEKIDDNMTEAQIIDLVQRKLKLHNKVKRTLSLEELKGDFSIRGGSTILVDIEKIADISIMQWLMVEKCIHTIKNNEHTMKIDLRDF